MPTPGRDRVSISDSYRRDVPNGLNALRLFFAVVVIFGHAFHLAVYGGTSIEVGGVAIETLAVFAFFGVSGYLITASRMTSSFGRYMWHRFLRIFPGYWVALLFVAFIAAPFFSGYDTRSATSFVLHNSPLYPVWPWEVAQVGIGSTLSSLPFPGTWIGPAWTLFWEFFCYVAIGTLVLFTRDREKLFKLVVAGCIPVMAGCLTIGLGASDNYWLEKLSAPLLAFGIGSLLCLASERIPLSGKVALALVILSLISISTSTFYATSPVALPYVSLYVGSRLRAISISSRNDISYGVYIYGWPIQQVVLTSLPSLTGSAFAAASTTLVLTIPLAFASRRLVEMPFERLKNWQPRRKNVGELSPKRGT